MKVIIWNKRMWEELSKGAYTCYLEKNLDDVMAALVKCLIVLEALNIAGGTALTKEIEEAVTEGRKAMGVDDGKR